MATTHPTNADSKYKSRQLVAAATIPALLVGGLIIYLSFVNDRLPEQVATHWDANGTPDGFTSRSSLSLQLAAIMVAVTLPATLIALFAEGATAFMPKAINGLPAGVAGFVASLLFLSIQPQIDTTAPPDLGLWVIPVALVFALVAGAVGAAVAGNPPAAPTSVAPAPADAERLDLPEGSTGAWVGRTPMGSALVISFALSLILGVVVSALSSWWVLAIFALSLLFVLSLSSFNVSAGPTGVRVSGMFGFPRITIPLAEITEVSAGSVRALEYGGWGWRIKKGSTAVLTRSGPALSISRTDGALLHVTIDDPEKPAALLSTLLDRRADA